MTSIATPSDIELGSSHSNGYAIAPTNDIVLELGANINHDNTHKDEELVRERRSTSGSRYRSNTFSPWVPDNAPIVLAWTNLCVSTLTNPPKLLLKNISGSITGGFWAIMGGSGSGKTTLLSTLSLRLDSSKMSITGDMRMNGREYEKNNLKAMTAYVLQDDLIHAELTVEETLMYAAKLRLAGICDELEQQDRIDEVINLMGIDHIRDVIIGDSRRKGVSGGERKRVCVAMELLSRPRCLFLDEPTSGLDSSTALSVVSALKNLTLKGICTVICTIHQPQVKIFELFDNLLLMRKGEIVYQGSRDKSIPYFEAVGKPLSAGENPADYLIDAIGAPEHEMDDVKMRVVPVDLSMGLDKDFSVKNFKLDVWFSQFKTLFRRCMQQYLRRTDIILLNFLGTVVLSLFIGLGIWRDIGTTQLSVPKRVPSLFFACVTQGIIASLQCVTSFPIERAIVIRERAAGAYHVSAYFLAKTVVDIITMSWSPTLFSLMVYWMIGYQNVASKWFIYWAFMMLDAFAALSLATMVSCFCVTIELSTVVLSVMLELSRLYGGFFTSPRLLLQHYSWKFADCMSYLKYTFVGVALNELTGLELSCEGAKTCVHSGEVTIKANGYNFYTIEFCAGMLIVYIVAVRALAYGALRIFNK